MNNPIVREALREGRKTGYSLKLTRELIAKARIWAMSEDVRLTVARRILEEATEKTRDHDSEMISSRLDRTFTREDY